ncbi:MAG: DNA mismatch repair endonuclease MutL [Spirochaetes bacterium]|nr:DNA mismatch repair endonuclease MutL [Spirochaetota bacterium]
MSRKSIRELPPHIANRIAAGEVVERPASAAKELIENAVDAHATRVDIETAEGGISLLRVSDNGDGIPHDEVPLALTHHATSKIADIDDLDRIGTLGFRGEALASIADVSRLELVTKPADGDGTRMIVEGGIRKEYTIAAAAQGTSITVRNLFFNLPARFKFLKSPAKELVAIKEVVEAMILRYHGTGFTYANNGQVHFSYPPAKDRAERLAAVVGDSFPHLIRFTAEGGFFSVEGYVSDQEWHAASRRNSFIFINGRVVEHRSLAYNVKSAYDGIIPRDRFPCYYLYITIDTAKVDVNVHPSKREVRIKNEQEIISLIYHSIREVLTERARVFHVSKDPLAAITAKREETAAQTQDIPLITSENESGPSPRTTIDYQVTSTLPAGRAAEQVFTYESRLPSDLPEQRTAPAAKTSDGRITGNLRVIGQSFFSYIIAEHDDDLLVIDQHAAYERLNFERIRKRILAGTIEYEPLLVPLELEYGAREIDRIKEGEEDLARVGIIFDLLGPTTIAFDRIPVFLPKRDAGRILKEVLDGYLTHGEQFRFERFIDEAVETIACKLSPKVNDALSMADMQNLIDAIAAEGILGSCPHGRPFIIRMEKAYLDKKFFRL